MKVQGKTFKLLSGYFYVRSLLHGVICVTMCQPVSDRPTQITCSGCMWPHLEFSRGFHCTHSINSKVLCSDRHFGRSGWAGQLGQTYTFKIVCHLWWLITQNITTYTTVMIYHCMGAFTLHYMAAWHLSMTWCDGHYTAVGDILLRKWAGWKLVSKWMNAHRRHYSSDII